MTTESTPTLEIAIDTAKGADTKELPRHTARLAAAKQTAGKRPARKSAEGAKRRSKRKKTDHRPLKVMLTTGAFLATWMGTGWMAQQDAIAAAAAAQTNQPEPATVAYIAPDGTVSERTLNLEPVPQVVVSSNSSK